MASKFLIVLSLLFTLRSGAEAPRDPEAESLFELGAAAGMGELPDYPGSDQKRFRALALPYFVYRGKVFRSDQKEGMRARFIQNQDIDLDLSAAGSFPANSADNDARRGMPDLDWLAEFGPRLEVILSRLGGHGRLRFLLPVRGVFSTDFKNVVHRGLTYTPGLAVDFSNFPFTGWKTYLKYQTDFVDEKLARYFYEVEPLYATPTRPAFGGNGGFLQSDFMIAFVVPVSKFVRVYGGHWMSSLQGATNRASPLVKSSYYSSWMIGLTYLFYQSEEPGHE